jgi:hypothetical protein
MWTVSIGCRSSREIDRRTTTITGTRHYGDLAVVTYRSHYKSLLHPDFGESDFEVMRVLRKREGNWRIVAGHGVFIPPACPDPKSP